jgi:DNA-directed RNA polymerase subunit H (RpoH/RPB5)
MVRYHNGKVGDIFEIIRPSFVAGYSIEYKKVVSCSSDIIFPT